MLFCRSKLGFDWFISFFRICLALDFVQLEILASSVTACVISAELMAGAADHGDNVGRNDQHDKGDEDEAMHGLCVEQEDEEDEKENLVDDGHLVRCSLLVRFHHGEVDHHGQGCQDQRQACEAGVSRRVDKSCSDKSASEEEEKGLQAG